MLPRAATALLVVGLLVAAMGCAQPPPDFYNVPPTPAGPPGTVIRTAPSSFGGSVDHTAVAVQYRSTSATGQPNAVTGTVVVPDSRWAGPGERPIVSFAVGTQGLGDGWSLEYDLRGGRVRSFTDHHHVPRARISAGLQDEEIGLNRGLVQTKTFADSLELNLVIPAGRTKPAPSLGTGRWAVEPDFQAGIARRWRAARSWSRWASPCRSGSGLMMKAP